jgi:hypothetical protein
LDAVWWLDLELANGISDEHASNTIEIPLLAGLDASSKSVEAGLTELLETAVSNVPLTNHITQPSGTTLIRLVFSTASGIAARSDFLVYRLHGTPHVTSATSFLDPLSSVTGVAPKLSTSIGLEEVTELLSLAIGGVVGSTSCEVRTVETLRQELDAEFSKRLSVPWILSKPLTQSRVFWVQGRADIESSRQFYEAAKSLGITIVVLDQPGHWLEDDAGPHAHYREAFIPISVDGDEGLTQRVVDAVLAYPHKVDGIVTISDVRLPFVARACESLGLPTSPSAAYFLAGDKGGTRELENAATQNKEGFVVNTASDLGTILMQEKKSIQYPLIVKPCTGWNSDCVVKVQNQDELYAAVHRASARHANSPNRNTKVVVEPYIDGPEVDANFIVLDGEVLFCDISDDFPSTGDRVYGGSSATSANFMETLMDVPTKLPADEQEVLKSGLTGSIVRLGFNSGIFHCEARVRNSRAHYEEDDGGILDLYVPDRTESKEAPSCYLHEVNARSPGYINCVAALLAYGVDYYAVRLLLSLGPEEKERVKILAQPFLGSKPQYVLGVVVLPPTRAGVMASEDAVADYLVAHPSLQKHVIHYQTLRKKGEYVEGPDSSELLAVGYIIVASRKSRRQCLELSKQIKETFAYELQNSEGK